MPVVNVPGNFDLNEPFELITGMDAERDELREKKQDSSESDVEKSVSE